MQSRRIAPVLAVSVLATLAPAVAVAAPANAAPANSTNSTNSTNAAAQPLTWQRCGADTPAAFECATIKVPLDYRAPGGKKIEVAISRTKATDPKKRRGVLLFNPGGPGGSGVGDPMVWGGMLPQSVKDQYDLIGFDPRGVGKSTPVECGTAPQERRVLLPYSEATFDSSVAWARTFADKCRAKYGADLKHFTTRNTARDMDAIRAALGEKKISYVGVSYGTYLGAVYTQMFPHRSDRIVLDSSVDPSKAWRGTLRAWATGAEPAYDRWTRWTAQHHAKYGLGATPEAVDKSFWDLVARADREPIRVGDEVLDGPVLRETMRRAFFHRALGAEILVMVKKAAAGEPVEPPPSYVVQDNEMSLFQTIVCGDASWPRDLATYRRDAARDAARFPIYGDFGSNVTACAFWDDPVEPATKVNNRVGALMLQAEWDSQTPLQEAKGMHRAMKGSRMVTVDEGETHGVYLEGVSSCADAVATAYLTTGKLPAKDVTCAANPTPPPSSSQLPETADPRKRLPLQGGF
ncbi:alpha/beta hydrolase [Streptomyces sp. NPDC047315]|uniref:alpha/beta hydrolase n=1 Tax=Streptomyces sp. NPDC047315 TaxID=3155142 RepID=UPI0033EDF8CB